MNLLPAVPPVRPKFERIVIPDETAVLQETEETLDVVVGAVVTTVARETVIREVVEIAETEPAEEVSEVTSSRTNGTVQEVLSNDTTSVTDKKDTDARHRVEEEVTSEADNDDLDEGATPDEKNTSGENSEAPKRKRSRRGRRRGRKDRPPQES